MKKLIAVLLLASGLFLLGIFNLENYPLYWDEGWTLSVARTWVEQGFYGRLQSGEFAPPGLEAAFPITGLVALSFRLLGVGVWQGRLVGVIFLVGTTGLIAYLAQRLYNYSIAVATLAVLFFLSPYPYIHPLFISRMVFAELPMFFFLLAGYLCFLNGLLKSPWFFILATLCWGIALVSKAQTLPFWLASLGLPLSVALFKRNWRIAGWLATAVLGSIVVSQIWILAQGSVLRGHTLPTTQLPDMNNVVAIVLNSSVRIEALSLVLLIGLPTILGLGHAFSQWLNGTETFGSHDPTSVVRLALFILSSSWFAWYIILSNGAIRYLFPATFFGSFFVAAMLSEWMFQFNWRRAVVQAGGALRHLRFDRRAISAMAAILLISIFVPLTVAQVYREYIFADRSAIAVAHYLNSRAADDSLIESYESELFFLLNRRYHYPPDQINVEMLRHSISRDIDAEYDYDPLAMNPDYLVNGPTGHFSRLYAKVISTSAFRLINKIGEYEIYARVH